MSIWQPQAESRSDQGIIFGKQSPGALVVRCIVYWVQALTQTLFFSSICFIVFSISVIFLLLPIVFLTGHCQNDLSFQPFFPLVNLIFHFRFHFLLLHVCVLIHVFSRFHVSFGFQLFFSISFFHLDFHYIPSFGFLLDASFFRLGASDGFPFLSAIFSWALPSWWTGCRPDDRIFRMKNTCPRRIDSEWEKVSMVNREKRE